jgi:pimeloyl-ACP methyl ester carboxylesterase
MWPKWPLSEAACRKLDDAASVQKIPPIEEGINIAGTIPQFLLTRLYLPADEELKRSKAVHEDRKKRDTIQETPAEVARLLDRLSKAVPAYQKPGDLRFTLTVSEQKEPEISTPGGGYLHITSGLLEKFPVDKYEPALAYILAREVGHVALGHTRRGWQQIILEEDLRNTIETGIDPSTWRDLLETRVIATGKMVRFLYSRNQEYRADLYAFHLCRNAGIPLDEAISGMRYLVVEGKSETSEPLLRLKRLLLERDGIMEPEEDFGLFRYDRKTTKREKCKKDEITKDQRPIIFVHGLFGSDVTWKDFLPYFAEQKELEDRPLLIFRMPGNGSLARSGHFLYKEVSRVLAAPDKATFIGYSAGGLVFRWYAEKLGGAFEHAVIMATPHEGSDLSRIKFLIDLMEFGGSLRLGFAEGLSKLLHEGRGEIGLDLHPGSLFLASLGHDAKLAKRYHILYGQVLGPVKSIALETGLAAARDPIEQKLLPQVPPGLLRRQTEALLRVLTFPPEILHGDGVVSMTSAKLAGAAKYDRLPIGHIAFHRDTRARKIVLESIRGK